MRRSPTAVADEYFAVSEKVEALYDRAAHLPADAEGAEMLKLRREMNSRMLGNGHCARPVEMDCHFESICESCTFFVTTIEPSPPCSANAKTPPPKAKSVDRKSSTESSNDSTTRRPDVLRTLPTSPTKIDPRKSC